LGLGEAAAGVRVDLVDVPYGALCYAVRPPDDVRILLSPRDGHAYYGVLFHEFGHAIYQRCLRPLSPLLRRESSPFDEAMACVWERLASDPDWLVDQGGITPGQAAAYRRHWARRLVYRLRVFMAQATFEYRAYQDRAYRGGDLMALLQDIYAEHLGVPYDQAPGWADRPFWTSHPIYMQNYVIAETIASQTLAALGCRFDRLIGQPQVGVWLIENYYAPGASSPWADKVARATGAPLGAAPLLADLGCDA
jgi:peptidyl-dipeptidase A